MGYYQNLMYINIRLWALFWLVQNDSIKDEMHSPLFEHLTATELTHERIILGRDFIRTHLE